MDCGGCFLNGSYLNLNVVLVQHHHTSLLMYTKFIIFRMSIITAPFSCLHGTLKPPYWLLGTQRASCTCTPWCFGHTGTHVEIEIRCLCTVRIPHTHAWGEPVSLCAFVCLPEQQCRRHTTTTVSSVFKKFRHSKSSLRFWHTAGTKLISWGTYMQSERSFLY